MANVTAGIVETLRVHAIKFFKNLHTTKVCSACELASLSLEVRIKFSIS